MAIATKPRTVSAFYTPDDGTMHAIVAQADGGVREVYYVDQQFHASSVIAHFDGIVGVAGYYTPVDRFRHVIVLLHNGQLWEIFYNPRVGIFQDLLTTVDTAQFDRTARRDHGEPQREGEGATARQTQRPRLSAYDRD